MRPRVYIETTIPSYLTCRPSRDVIRLGHEVLTRQWWDTRRVRFDLVTSQLVWDECSRGDPEMAAARLTSLQDVRQLDITDGVGPLAATLVAVLRLPPKAAADATHVAVAAVHGVEYLLTWNCTHLANAALWRQIETVCQTAGLTPPQICTPYDLMGPLL